jgi:histidinol-phosphate aminotransferase
MINIEKLIRPHLKSLIPYSSAREEYKGEEGIFLDANENSFGSTAGNNYNRYPDPYQQKIKRLLASIKKIPADSIFLGNGSDEIIDLVIRLFCIPGIDQIVITPPTYGMYEVSAEINEAGIIRVPLTGNYQLNTLEILRHAKRKPKILFLCTPNNPTGNSLRKPDVLKLIKEFSGIILIDEAYADFSRTSYLNQIRKHPNLIVMQTFSKAWGMAGLRLGVAYAGSNIVSYLNKIKPPYNVNQATQILAEKAILNKAKKEIFVKKIIGERKRLENELRKLKIVEKVNASDANFLLVKFRDSGKVFNYLVKNAIIVRDRSNVKQCGNSLRITIGTPGENNILTASLTEFQSLTL